MKNILLYLLGTYMLLSMTTPSIAQSTRLDSLQRVKQNLELQTQRLQIQYDSIDRILYKCKTDEELLKHYSAREKIDKKGHKLATQINKVQHDIEVEEARIEQVKREAHLAQKRVAVQAVSPVPLQGTTNGHTWVDMGLPSGTRWATYNVGTTTIHGVGTRIAWGETATKKLFSPKTYTHNDIELPSYAGNAKYDLATSQWGEGWYTPTLQQWEELIEHCEWEYVMINGSYGVLFTSHKTYNAIFLPSTGYTDDETYKLKYTTYNLAYWTSTGERTNGAHSYIANYEQGYMTTTNRYIAHCVRAVCGTSDITAATTQNVSTPIQDASNIVHDTAVVIPDSSSTIQPDNKAKQTAKTIQETAKTIKKTAKTIKTLHNILKR